MFESFSSLQAKIREKQYDFLYGVKSCFVFSWNSSKLLTVLRMMIEILLAVLPMISIFISKELINLLVRATSQGKDINTGIYKLCWLVLTFAVVEIISRILNNVRELCGNLHKEMIDKHINTQLASKAISIDLSFFDSSEFYNQLENAKKDARALETLTWHVINIARSGFQFLFSLIILAKLNFIFAIVLALIALPAMIMERRYTQRVYRMERHKIPEVRSMNYIHDVLTNRMFSRDIRLFDIGSELINRYLKIWDKWFKERRVLIIHKGIVVGLLSILPKIVEAGLLLYVGVGILQGGFTVGDYTLYSGILSQLTGGLFMLIGLFSSIYDNNMRIQNYNSFIKIENEIEDGKVCDIKQPVKIIFENVSFKYPKTDKYVLKNVSFCINGNEKIALVGLNGSGKSTIIKLILRFYDATEGTIYINGINIKDYNIKILRKQFSVMFQDYVNYAFTIKDNITLSDMSNKDDEDRIVNACIKGDAQSVVNKFESGLDTYLSRQYEADGKELSGGEWQKIALARTFFRDGSFIILDEPSAALDPEAEHKIFTKFSELCEGKGALFVSHRLSNVTMADRIIVLDKGEIVEDGSHKELLATPGKYAYLFNLQAQKFKVV